MVELDVRTLPPPKKHATIHELLEELATGDTLRIVNDHDPRPLRYELEHDYPGAFSWSYVEAGPQTWRVDIQKTRSFELKPGFELLADCSDLSVHGLELQPLGSVRLGFDSSTALIFTQGAGTIGMNGHTHPIAAGRVELVTAGDECTITASGESELRGYVASTKPERRS